MIPRWKQTGRLLPTAIIVWANCAVYAQDVSSRPGPTTSPQLSLEASDSPVLPTMQSPVRPVPAWDRDGARTASQSICGRAGRETRPLWIDHDPAQSAVSRTVPHGSRPGCGPCPSCCPWTRSDRGVGRDHARGKQGTRRRGLAGWGSSAGRERTGNRSGSGGRSDSRTRRVRRGDGTRRSWIRWRRRSGRGVISHDR